MTKFVKLALAAMFGLLIVFSAAAADLQKTIGYSGYLTDAAGPINIDKVITFRIWDAATGGTAVWVEEIPVVHFIDGEFSVSLGELVPFSSAAGLNFHSNTQYWLGITIGPITNTNELSPRKPLLFVPYSFSSELELRTSDPATPVTGQMWLRTDL